MTEEDDLIQPKHLQCKFTMIKELPHNYMKAISEISKSKKESSFCIDFKRLKYEDGLSEHQLTVIEGTEINAPSESSFHSHCSMHGHTHPNEDIPLPSYRDLDIQSCHPKFIVGGNNGTIMFFNVEDKDKHIKYLKNMHRIEEKFKLIRKESGVDYDIRLPSINVRKIYEKYGRDFMEKYGYGIYGNNLLKDKRGRDVFFDQTGVRVYPYKKGMKIELWQV